MTLVVSSRTSDNAKIRLIIRFFYHFENSLYEYCFVIVHLSNSNHVINDNKGFSPKKNAKTEII